MSKDLLIAQLVRLNDLLERIVPPSYVEEMKLQNLLDSNIPCEIVNCFSFSDEDSNKLNCNKYPEKVINRCEYRKQWLLFEIRKGRK